MYQIKFYTGDYYERQDKANKDKCVGYIEQHFNSSTVPSAGYAEKVLHMAKELLKDVGAIPQERTIKVMRGNHTEWSGEIDADSQVSWDPSRGVLCIDEV